LNLQKASFFHEQFDEIEGSNTCMYEEVKKNLSDKGFYEFIQGILTFREIDMNLL